ncbi:adenylate kinase, subfamily protein, nonfunctional [Candidatus Saccharibacteria bacterium RAAC3_TM7_1]|nr:adenylate kinase, subfamily protein, nonfunctional [Candidatus Saccharibacteria bacterium RAAC3_TM7_1]HCZ28652.1 adenylate kinase [Candidatus Saccharibacteria bacterium]
MILLFGPTGAGKSMQGQMLAVRQGWKWLSTGEMLRDSRDPAIIQILKSGDLVSDAATFDVFHEAVEDANAKHFPNIIVDGFPRTKVQAEWLARYLDKTDQHIDLVAVLEVPETEIMARLEKRGRMEDTPETIAKRMTIYRQKMYPVLGIFAEQGIKIVHLDGTGTAGEVHDRLYAEVMHTIEE